MPLPVPRRRSPLTSWPRELWDPFDDFGAIWNRVGNLFEPFGPNGWLPAIETEDTDDAYLVRAELPGMKREDIGIDVAGGELRIVGETTEETTGSTLRRRQGRFAYRTSLPADADPEQAKASLADGILTIRLPKTSQSRSRRIEITG